MNFLNIYLLYEELILNFYFILQNQIKSNKLIKFSIKFVYDNLFVIIIQTIYINKLSHQKISIIYNQKAFPMKNQSLPKFLFLHEQSQQMQDRRIRVKLEYDNSSNPPKKIYKKKINNTIKFNQKLKENDLQINNLAYSNKLGLLVVCIQSEVLFIDFQKLEGVFTRNNVDSLKKISAGLKFSGKVYMSPNETKLLLVNENQIIFYDLQKLTALSRGLNQFKLRHFVFVNDNSIAGWNFLSKAYFFSNITLNFQNIKSFQNVQKCTSVSIVQSHIFLSEKINMGSQDDQSLKLHIWNQKCSQLLNQIDLSQFENQDNYLFNFTQILSIFPIKIQNASNFSSQDTYGLVVGYYDDIEEEPDRRYLNFLKGNILQKNQKLEIRGFELFQSPNQERPFYYNQNNEKLPFEVQIIYNKQMILIMIQKLQTVFVVDATLKFQDLNMYSVNPLHQIKLEGGKFFKGMTIIKNMLNFQRLPSKEEISQKSSMICQNFKGEFMSLYFPAKQTQLTVPYPASVLVMGDNTILRRYAVSTMEGLQQYDIPKIKQGLKNVKSSYLQNMKNSIKIQVGIELPLTNNFKKSGQTQIKEPKKLLGQTKIKQKTNSLSFENIHKKQQSISGDTKEDKLGLNNLKKDGLSSLFGENTNKINLFSSVTKKEGPSLFNQTNKGDLSIFGNQTNPVIQQKKQGGLFGQPQKQNQSQGSLFTINTQKNVTLNNCPTFLSKNQPIKQSQFSNTSALLNIKAQTASSQLNKIKQSLTAENINEIQQKIAQDKAPILLFSNQSKDENKQDNKLQKNEPKQQEKSKIQQNKVIVPKTGLNLSNTNLMFNAMKKKKQSSVQSTLHKKQEGLLSPKNQNQKKTQNIKQQKQPQSQQVLKKKITTQKQEKALPTSQQIKNQKKQSKKQNLSKPPINFNQNKFNELAVILGHESYQKMPPALKNLTPGQVQELLSSLRPLQKGYLINSKQNLEQQARKKLIMKQHCKKIVKKFNQVKQFIKSLKGINQIIQSSTIFSFKNAQILLAIPKQQPLNDIKNDLIKNYTKRMQNLQKRYLIQIAAKQQDKNYNKYRQNQYRDKQKQILNKIQIYEEKNCILQHFNSFILPQSMNIKTSLFKNTENQFFNQNEYFQNKIIAILMQKAQNSDKLRYLIENKLEQINSQFNKKTQTKKNKKCSQIGSIHSKKSQKGCFKFSLDNSSDQNDQLIQDKVQKIIKNNKEELNNPKSQLKNNKKVNFQKINQNYKDQRKILIKFKPKVINLQKQSAKITPLFNFDQKLQYMKTKQVIKSSTVLSHPQNSTKKSVDFKQKIPFQKIIIQQQKDKIFKQSESIDLSNSSSQKDEEEIVAPLPVMRMMSTLHQPPKKDNEQKIILQDTKKQQELKIKKTQQKDLKIDSKKELQKKASLFGVKPSANIIGQKQNKNQKSQKSQGNKSLFGQTNTDGFTGINKQKSLNKIEQKKLTPQISVKLPQKVPDNFITFDQKIEKSKDPNQQPKTTKQIKQQQEEKNTSLLGAKLIQDKDKKIQKKTQNIQKSNLLENKQVKQSALLMKNNEQKKLENKKSETSKNVLFGQIDKQSQNQGENNNTNYLFGQIIKEKKQDQKKAQQKKENLSFGMQAKINQNKIQKLGLFGETNIDLKLFGDKQKPKADVNFAEKNTKQISSLFGENKIGGLQGNEKIGSLFKDKKTDQKDEQNKTSGLYGPKPISNIQISAKFSFQNQADQLKASKQDFKKQEQIKQQQTVIFSSSQLNTTNSFVSRIGHQTAKFGGQNKFSTGNTQISETNNALNPGLFNPSQLSFKSQTNTNKSFFNLPQTNIAPSLFNQNIQSGQTESLFGQKSNTSNCLFGQQNNYMFNQSQGQNSMMVGQNQNPLQQPQQQQLNSMFGNTNNAQMFNNSGFGSSQTNTSLLSGFQVSNNTISQPLQNTAGSNSSMYKPRK